MFVVKLRRGCVPPLLLEVFAGTLDVAYEDFSQLLVSDAGEQRWASW
jgi:hypothetical protein